MILSKNNTIHSDRVKPILQLTSLGLTAWQISQKLKMSESQVESIIQRLRINNECANTVALVAMALREGVIK